MRLEDVQKLTANAAEAVWRFHKTDPEGSNTIVAYTEELRRQRDVGLRLVEQFRKEIGPWWERAKLEHDAANRWRAARLAVVNLSISDTRYRVRLNDLSEAESALASFKEQS